MDRTVITVVPPTTYGTFKVSSINAFSSGVSPTTSPTSRQMTTLLGNPRNLLDTDADSQILCRRQVSRSGRTPSNQCNTDQSRGKQNDVVWNASGTEIT